MVKIRTFFLAKINNKKKPKWYEASLYQVLDILERNDIASSFGFSEPISEGPELSRKAHDAINRMLNKYEGSHRQFIDKMLSIISIEEINELVEGDMGPDYLIVTLQDEMMSEFADIWKVMFAHSPPSPSIGLAGTIKMHSDKAPVSGFLEAYPSQENQEVIQNDEKLNKVQNIIIDGEPATSIGNKIRTDKGAVYTSPLYASVKVAREFSDEEMASFDNVKVYSDLPGSPIGKSEDTEE